MSIISDPTAIQATMALTGAADLEEVVEQDEIAPAAELSELTIHAPAALEVEEDGRRRGNRAAESHNVPNRSATATPKDADGHVRRGFVGLADVMAWLAQVDSPADDHRVAQLFRPTTDARPLFRLAVAVMRKKFRALPVLLVGAFGNVSKVANWILLALAVVVLAMTRQSARWSLIAPAGAPWWRDAIADYGAAGSACWA